MENAATNIAKLILDGLPANAEAMTLPIKARIRRVQRNWEPRRMVCMKDTILAIGSAKRGVESWFGAVGFWVGVDAEVLRDNEVLG